MWDLLEKKNQTRRDPAPPPALGGDIDMRNRSSRTSLSMGKYMYLLAINKYIFCCVMWDSMYESFASLRRHDLDT